MERLRFCMCLIIILILVLSLRTQARPLNPNMERKNKNQSFSMSPLVKVVPPLPSPPSPWSNDYIGKGNNHEMSGGQGVHGEVVPLKKGSVTREMARGGPESWVAPAPF